MNPIELQNRIRQFSIDVISIEPLCRVSFHTMHLINQLIRSSSSANLNYAEARSAESKVDYIHKMRLVLKELKESKENLAIISKTSKSEGLTSQAIELHDESDELNAIIAKSIQTATKNLQLEGNRKSIPQKKN